MAAPRLKVGGFDFSPYLRTQPDESTPMDPAAAGYFRPQFSGAPALGEGASWVGDAVDNRTMSFPVYFTAGNREELKELIQEANTVLVKGAQVEFCIDPDVDVSSFFDLERGTVNEEFNFYHLVNTVAGAVLTLTTRPYSHTATHRLVASVPAATSAVVEFAASGIDGDAFAFANLEVRVGSAVASAGRLIAWGVHPHPSHNAYRQAKLLNAQASTFIISSATAVGSFYAAMPISPTGASGVSYQQFLDPPAAHVGRHRVIALARSGLEAGIAMFAEDRFGAVLGPTAIASQTDQTKWQAVDLGEVNVPARASGQDAIPTQYVNIRAGAVAASGHIAASPAFQLNGLTFLPLDYSAGILRTKGSSNSSFLLDSLKRWLEIGAFEGETLDELPVMDTGQAWSKLGGTFQTAVQGGKVNYVPGKAEGSLNASALYAAASGAAVSNVLAQVDFVLDGAIPSFGAASAALTLWSPARTNASIVTGGVGVRFQLGPSQFMAIYSASSNGATAMKASAGIPSTLASTVFKSTPYTLTMRVLEGRVDAWVSPSGLGASPVISASAADLTQVGWAALQANQGGGAGNGLLYVRNFRVSSLGVGASDISARETFRFESHPEGRVYQGTASAFTADRLADYRGQSPKMPPSPQPQRTNLVLNPSFEANTNKWLAGEGGFRSNVGGTLTRDTGQHQDGVAAGKYVSGGLLAFEGPDTGNTVAVKAGQTYRVSVYVKGNAGGETLRLSIGNAIPGGLAKEFTATTGWQRIDAIYRPTADAVTGLAIVTAAKLSVTYWIDAVMVEPVEALRPYFPTAEEIASGAAAFTGTANESVSVVPNALQETEGPARVVVLQGEIDNLQGQDGPDISLSVLERYRFLR